MNVYFLVEGQRTEAIVYPAWLSELLPTFRRVDQPDQASKNCYYLISANGYPSVVQETLKNAIADVNELGTYDYLVVCLDADNLTSAERLAEVKGLIEEQAQGRSKAEWTLRRAELKFVIQNRTIETWFLGNRKLFSDAPQSLKLREFLEFEDVRVVDPEMMKLHPEFEYHADFHHEYLKETFRERKTTYSKRNPWQVQQKSFLEQLLSRVDRWPAQLKSFQDFVFFCREVERLVRL